MDESPNPHPQFRRARAVLAVLVAVVGVAGAQPVPSVTTADRPAEPPPPTPATNRLEAFADRVLRGRARVAVVGDSINSEATAPRMPLGFLRRLTPDRWAGMYAYGFASGTSPSFQAMNNRNAKLVNPGTPLPDGSPGNIWPGPFGVRAPDASDLAPYAVVPPEFVWVPGARRTVFSGGDWVSGSDIAVRMITYRPPSGFMSIGVVGLRGFDSFGFRNVVPLSVGYGWVDLPPTVGPDQLQAQWRGSGDGQNETGRMFVGLGARAWSPSRDGLEMAFFGNAGKGVDFHVDPTKISDAAISAAVTALEIDTVIVWLGANDAVANYDQTWRARMDALVDRWRRAVTAQGREVRILVVSQYALGGQFAANLPKMAADLYEISLARADVAFINVYRLAGPYATLNAMYLADGVHPNAAGVDYLAGIIDSALQAAAPLYLPCGSTDIDGDGDAGTDADLEAFFVTIAGGCPACQTDIDGDGDAGTDADVEAFFRLLSGGSC